MRRGETRFLLLDALRDGPKHGYEIIKALEDRSGGEYVPSPGSVYPTLQHLDELGFVRADQTAERRTFHLTETGRAELDAHADEITVFWQQFDKPATSSANKIETGFLQDELDHLNRTVWNGLRDTPARDDTDIIRHVRQAIERCRDDVRGIVSGGNTK